MNKKNYAIIFILLIHVPIFTMETTRNHHPIDFAQHGFVGKVPKQIEYLAQLAAQREQLKAHNIRLPHIVTVTGINGGKTTLINAFAKMFCAGKKTKITKKQLLKCLSKNKKITLQDVHNFLKKKYEAAAKKEVDGLAIIKLHGEILTHLGGPINFTDIIKYIKQLSTKAKRNNIDIITFIEKSGIATDNEQIDLLIHVAHPSKEDIKAMIEFHISKTGLTIDPLVWQMLDELDKKITTVSRNKIEQFANESASRCVLRGSNCISLADVQATNENVKFRAELESKQLEKLQRHCQSESQLQMYG